MQGQEFILDISQISNVRYPAFVSLAPKYVLKLKILELKIFVIPHLGFLPNLPWKCTACKMHEYLTLFKMPYLEQKTS